MGGRASLISFKYQKSSPLSLFCHQSLPRQVYLRRLTARPLYAVCTAQSLVSVVPYPVGEALDVEPVEVLVRVEAVHIVVEFVVIGAVVVLLLLVIVVHIIHAVHLHRRVLLVILLHDLQVHLVVHLEALGLDLLLPVFIVDLHVVQNRVDKHANIRILI